MTQNKRFIIDVAEPYHENAFFEYNESLDDYDFVCLEDDFDEILKKFNSLGKENQELKKKLNDKQKHIFNLENKIHRMRESIKKLEYLYHYRRQDCDVDVKKEAWLLSKKVQNLQNENHRLQKRNVELAEEKNRLKFSIDKICTEITEKNMTTTEIQVKLMNILDKVD